MLSHYTRAYPRSAPKCRCRDSSNRPPCYRQALAHNSHCS